MMKTILAATALAGAWLLAGGSPSEAADLGYRRAVAPAKIYARRPIIVEPIVDRAYLFAVIDRHGPYFGFHGGPPYPTDYYPVRDGPNCWQQRWYWRCW